jgi:hypothetical protein
VIVVVDLPSKFPTHFVHAIKRIAMNELFPSYSDYLMDIISHPLMFTDRTFFLVTVGSHLSINLSMIFLQMLILVQNQSMNLGRKIMMRT